MHNPSFVEYKRFNGLAKFGKIVEINLYFKTKQHMSLFRSGEDIAIINFSPTNRNQRTVIFYWNFMSDVSMGR